MRILLISCVFPPEPVTSAQTSAQIAQELVLRGHDVEVLAPFPNRPSGKLYPGYTRRLIQRQKAEEGFRIVRCYSIFSSNSGMISRFLENLSFGVTSGLVLLFSRRPEVIYANTWPLFAAGIVSAVARIRRIPLVISMQDIYPELLILRGKIKPGGLSAKVLGWIDGWISRGSRKLIAISDRFAAIYRDKRKVPKDRIHVIPNWMDEDAIIPLAAPEEVRRKHNIPIDAFLCVYAGSISETAGVELVVEAFRILECYDNIHLLIAGDGTNLSSCLNLVKKYSLRRVHFHSPWKIEETSTLLSSANVSIIPTRGEQSLASHPSKLISYMLSARPIIAVSLPESDLANIVNLSRCGWVVNPERPELIAEKIRDVSRMPSDDLAHMGILGCNFALNNLTRKLNLPRAVTLIENAGGISI